MTKKTIAWILAATLAASGCASAGRTPVSPAPVAPGRAQAEMADYVARLPVGSRVRVDRSRGGSIKGTLMSASRERVVVQRSTRIPESPAEIPLDTITRIDVDERSNVTKIVLLSAAIGAAATVGFLFLLASVLDD